MVQFLVAVTTIPFSKTSQVGMKPVWLSIIWDSGLRDTAARKGRCPHVISDFSHNILRSELFWNFTQHTDVLGQPISPIFKGQYATIILRFVKSQKSADLKLTSYLLLVLNFRKTGAITPFPHISMWNAQGQICIYLRTAI